MEIKLMGGDNEFEENLVDTEIIENRKKNTEILM